MVKREEFNTEFCRRDFITCQIKIATFVKWKMNQKTKLRLQQKFISMLRWFAEGSSISSSTALLALKVRVDQAFHGQPGGSQASLGP